MGLTVAALRPPCGRVRKRTRGVAAAGSITLVVFGLSLVDRLDFGEEVGRFRNRDHRGLQFARSVDLLAELPVVAHVGLDAPAPQSESGVRLGAHVDVGLSFRGRLDVHLDLDDGLRELVEGREQPGLQQRDVEGVAEE